MRVTLAGEDWVLFRDAAGRPAALADRCPHRFAPLSEGWVADGRIVCPYHGWRFDAAGRGESPASPDLPCAARALRVEERHGYLWVAPPDADLAAFPSVDAPGFTPAGSFVVRAEAPLPLVLDNFSEDEHLPWIHARLGWTPERLGEVEFAWERHPDRSEVRYRGPQRWSPVLRALFLAPGDQFHNDWVTRFDPVHAVFTMYWTAPSGARRPLVVRTAVFLVPETERRTALHVFPFVRIEAPRLRFLAPLVARAALALGWLEVRDDARFLRKMDGAPVGLGGARLGRYDAPLVHNRALLRRLYLGEAEPPADAPRRAE